MALFETTLSDSIQAGDVQAPLLKLPRKRQGFLEIAPDTNEREVVYYTEKLGNVIQFQLGPGKLAEGFGRGLEDTVGRDHEMGTLVRQFEPEQYDLPEVIVRKNEIIIRLKQPLKISGVKPAKE